jgi:hypothetical protein
MTKLAYILIGGSFALRLLVLDLDLDFERRSGRLELSPLDLSSDMREAAGVLGVLNQKCGESYLPYRGIVSDYFKTLVYCKVLEAQATPYLESLDQDVASFHIREVE